MRLSTTESAPTSDPAHVPSPALRVSMYPPAHRRARGAEPAPTRPAHRTAAPTFSSTSSSTTSATSTPSTASSARRRCTSPCSSRTRSSAATWSRACSTPARTRCECCLHFHRRRDSAGCGHSIKDKHGETALDLVPASDKETAALFRKARAQATISREEVVDGACHALSVAVLLIPCDCR